MYISNLLKIFILTLSISACALGERKDCETRRLASFDIGSGSTKFLLAELNSCKAQQMIILMKDSKPVSYAQDLANSGKSQFSEEIIQKGEETIGEFLKSAQAYGDFQIRAVATQAFRQAHNGQEIVHKWQQKFSGDWKVISQDEEAKLAYSFVEFKTSKQDRLLVWDIGGGSQQLVWQRSDKQNNIQMMKSTLASVSFKNAVLKYLKRPAKVLTPNPLSLSEHNLALDLALSLIAKEKNSELSNWLAKPAVIIGIGGVHGGSLKNQLGLKEGEKITQRDLRQLLQRKQNLSDKEIGGSYATTEITNLILVLGMMMTYDIKEYVVMEASLTEALVVDGMR